MSYPIDHHFIPAFFLTQWADANDKLIEYAIKHGKLIPKPVGPRATEILGKHVNNMKWCVIDVSYSPHRFLLSDRPVVFANLKNPDGLVYVPIGPTKLFVAVNTPDRLQRLRALPPRELVHIQTDSLSAALANSCGLTINRRPHSSKSTCQSEWSRHPYFPTSRCIQAQRSINLPPTSS